VLSYREHAVRVRVHCSEQSTQCFFVAFQDRLAPDIATSLAKHRKYLQCLLVALDRLDKLILTDGSGGFDSALDRHRAKQGLKDVLGHTLGRCSRTASRAGRNASRDAARFCAEETNDQHDAADQGQNARKAKLHQRLEIQCRRRRRRRRRRWRLAKKCEEHWGERRHEGRRHVNGHSACDRDHD
jgi:hypothetical protein